MHPAAAKALFEEAVSNLSPALARRRGWVFHAIEFPMIDCSFTAPARATLRLRLLCDDWNDLPPAISLHSADGVFLTTLPRNSTNVFNPGPHPATQRPFICMRGAREYHTHPSHVSDPWESLKNSPSYTLGGILTQLWNAWQKGSG
ncbi:MAG: putative metal-binding protein [Acidobacteriaceae bacterium]